MVYEESRKIVCSTTYGILYTDTISPKLKCIYSSGEWFTPCQFERYCGRSRTKSWKRSIRDVESGKCLDELFKSQMLFFTQHTEQRPLPDMSNIENPFPDISNIENTFPDKRNIENPLSDMSNKETPLTDVNNNENDKYIINAKSTEIKPIISEKPLVTNLNQSEKSTSLHIEPLVTPLNIPNIAPVVKPLNVSNTAPIVNADVLNPKKRGRGRPRNNINTIESDSSTNSCGSSQTQTLHSKHRMSRKRKRFLRRHPNKFDMGINKVIKLGSSQKFGTFCSKCRTKLKDKPALVSHQKLFHKDIRCPNKLTKYPEFKGFSLKSENKENEDDCFSLCIKNSHISYNMPKDVISTSVDCMKTPAPKFLLRSPLAHMSQQLPEYQVSLFPSMVAFAEVMDQYKEIINMSKRVLAQAHKLNGQVGEMKKTIKCIQNELQRLTDVIKKPYLSRLLHCNDDNFALFLEVLQKLTAEYDKCQ